MSKHFDLADRLDTKLTCAQSFTHMLNDLLVENDNIPDELDINDPASRTQRMFAVLEALQGNLEAIEEIGQEVRSL